MFKNLSALSTLGLCLLVASSCDDSAEQRNAASKTQTKTKPRAPAPTPTPAPPPAPPADLPGLVKGYSGCYTACFSEKGPATNRETCKLNCDASVDAALAGIPDAPHKDTLTASLSSFNTCVNACYDDKSLNATNRATCVLTCQDSAEVAVLK